MNPTILIIVYCVLISIASYCGGWLPFLIRMTHTRMQLMISFVGGLMLGVGMLYMLPHAIDEFGHANTETPPHQLAIYWTMIGLLSMFLLIRTFHFHQHGPAEDDDSHDHDHASHSHDPASDDSHPSGVHGLSWTGVALGSALHSVIEGVALAASVVAQAAQTTETKLVGLGTFLAVILHKPLDAFPTASLMAASGWSVKARHTVNVAVALTCPLGAALFYEGWQRFGEQQNLVVGCALGFSAGVFLCISLGDLLPEVHFHRHDRMKLSTALLSGVALAYLIGSLGGHVHP